MKKVIISLLILCAINWLMDRHFAREDASHRKAEAARHAVTSSSTSYDIQGLNDLVGRLSAEKRPSLVERQAKAYAEVYGLTKQDLKGPINLFGE